MREWIGMYLRTTFVSLQLFPDICNWKPKSKTITIEKFSVFCLVVPNLMSLEISPPEIEELFEASIKASSDKGRKAALVRGSAQRSLVLARGGHPRTASSNECGGFVVDCLCFGCVRPPGRPR